MVYLPCSSGHGPFEHCAWHIIADNVLAIIAGSGLDKR